MLYYWSIPLVAIDKFRDPPPLNIFANILKNTFIIKCEKLNMMTVLEIWKYAKILKTSPNLTEKYPKNST